MTEGIASDGILKGRTGVVGDLSAQASGEVEMTEREWLESTNLPAMLAHVARLKSREHRGGSDRKLRLFAVACWYHCIACDRLDPDNLRTLKAGEDLADGLIDRAAMIEASHGGICLTREPAIAAAHSTVIASGLAGNSRLRLTLFRDIVGNPFHKPIEDCHNRNGICVTHDCKYVSTDRYLRNGLPTIRSRCPAGRAWFRDKVDTSMARSIAEDIYVKRRFDELPVLADALEDAGCNGMPLLDHLRSPGPHVLGCWALDFVLAKEGTV